MPARVFVTRRLPGSTLERLEGSFEVDLWPHPSPPDPASLLDRAREADAILSLLTDRIDVGLMDACPQLRVISNLAVGVDNIDVMAASARGIAVGHTPDVLTDATADLTMALLLAAARRLPEGMSAVRQGKWGPWSPEWLLGLELRGARLAVVGLGRIGAAVVRRASAFGMEVIPVGREDRQAVRERLATADVVSLHCPLTADTHHLIDEAAFRAMKPGAILVNTARGGIVDQDALADALSSGHLRAAALDVTDPEPLPPAHPLLEAPNLIVTPHLGSATERTRERMARIAVENVIAGLSRRPLPHAVTVGGLAPHVAMSGRA